MDIVKGMFPDPNDSYCNESWIAKTCNSNNWKFATTRYQFRNWRNDSWNRECIYKFRYDRKTSWERALVSQGPTYFLTRLCITSRSRSTAEVRVHGKCFAKLATKEWPRHCNVVKLMDDHVISMLLATYCHEKSSACLQKFFETLEIMIIQLLGFKQLSFSSLIAL